MTSLDDIELPYDLQWSDEHMPWAVAQDRTYSVTGALLVQESVRQSGRPVTLESSRGRPRWAIVLRPTIELLKAKVAVPIAVASSMTLTLPAPNTVDGTRTFQVRWRHNDGPPLEVRPIKHIVPEADADRYEITLRLMIV